MEDKNNGFNKEDSENKSNARYTESEDLAILHYMVTNNRFLQSSGIQVWKDAVKLSICPGRSYLSMKERFRKVIVRNLKQLNVEKDIANKITQFMRANQKDEVNHLVSTVSTTINAGMEIVGGRNQVDCHCSEYSEDIAIYNLYLRKTYNTL